MEYTAHATRNSGPPIATDLVSSTIRPRQHVEEPAPQGSFAASSATVAVAVTSLRAAKGPGAGRQGSGRGSKKYWTRGAHISTHPMLHEVGPACEPCCSRTRPAGRSSSAGAFQSAARQPWTKRWDEQAETSQQTHTHTYTHAHIIPDTYT